MVGMPGSGKTAYLGSTWILLNDGVVPTTYTKGHGIMPDDCTRLEQIAKEILSYRDLERTKEEEKTQLNISLNDKNGENVFLTIPDLAGEIFRDLVKDRRLHKDIVTKLLEADCILFFIYYKTMSPEKRIPIVGGNDTVKDKNQKVTDQNETDKLTDLYNDEQREANESEVVELLLLLLELLKKSRKPVNIRFIMSAWDMVEKERGEDILPQEFVKRKFPFLYQCIQSNQDRMNYEFWGVAALGGNVNDEKDRARLKKEENEAIKVVSPVGERSHDLTAVLAGLGDKK